MCVACWDDMEEGHGTRGWRHVAAEIELMRWM